ncbi:hypothetical protein LTR15_012580 [Elasticomyces elasticus]|nr:hypothetical protein LTR15_012580 [Elasticomyces elasticus]
MAESSQGQVVSTHGQGSTQVCRLLALPKELRLLVYEAYFGPTQKCCIDWEDGTCNWRRDPGSVDHQTVGLALLLTARQIHEEALAVMLDRTSVEFELDLETNASLRWANVLRLLRCVRVVEIEIVVDATNCVQRPSIDDLRAMLEAMDQGANLKQLTFDLISWPTSENKEPAAPNDEEFKAAISSLRCANGVVKYANLRNADTF